MTYNATITFDTKNNHPDSKNAKNLVFNDTYRIDGNYRDDTSARSYINNDLRLVAGGGYVTNTISNVKISIIREA